MAVIFLIAVVAALFQPWIGIAFYYLYALLGPQYIWWWAFQAVSVSYYLALVSLFGMAFRFCTGRIDTSFLKTRQSLWLVVLWSFVAISYVMGPYVSDPQHKAFTPKALFELYNTIVVMYFCTTLLLDDVRKLRNVCVAFLAVSVYLIYWGNFQYVFGNWSQFNNGRLMGPISIDGTSMYGDENGFAMIYVTGIPFLYYLGLACKKKWQRYFLWGMIPLGWHTIFLTGSRGGLLGLVAVTLYCARQMKNKRLVLLVVPIFLGFFLWQGGAVMKQRSETIKEYQEDSSAESRLTAWGGAIRMMEAYPLTGVGLGSFVTALPHFANSEPLVAHNTFFHYGGESGVGAAACYLVIAWVCLANSRRVSRWCAQHGGSEESRWLNCINEAATASFIGFFVCSMFLSLQLYEIYFYLLALGNNAAVICAKMQGKTAPAPAVQPVCQR